MAKTNGKATTTPMSKGWNADERRASKDAVHLQAMEEAQPVEKTTKRLILPKPDIRRVDITLVGDESLIVHKWSEKAIKQMLDKQMGVPSEGREPKDPEKDFRDSLYPHPGGGYGFPTIAFKNAAVSACTSLGKSVTKVQARQAFHVVGELAKIVGSEPIMREDMVRVGMGTADVRYRAEFMPWRVTLTIRYNARVLTDEQIFNLFNIAGFGVGVGEWRSEKDGNHGLFHVATGEEL